MNLYLAKEKSSGKEVLKEKPFQLSSQNKTDEPLETVTKAMSLKRGISF
jgi:hypothetical protein